MDRAGGYIRPGSPGKGSQITGGVRKGKKTFLLISVVDLKIANFEYGSATSYKRSIQRQVSSILICDFLKKKQETIIF